MEGQCGERWGRAGTFSCCSARSRSTERKVENPHLCSSLLFYCILFRASFLSSLRHWFASCSLPLSPHLSFNLFHPSRCRGCVREKEPGNERGWLAATKQTAAAAGRPLRPPRCPQPGGVAGGQDGLGGQDGHVLAPRWHPGGSPVALRWVSVALRWVSVAPRWVSVAPSSPARLGCQQGQGEATSFHGCSLLQRGSTEGAGGNDISSTADVFSVHMSQSLISKLCYLGGSSVISPFCPSCR